MFFNNIVGYNYSFLLKFKVQLYTYEYLHIKGVMKINQLDQEEKF